ncbi:MAG: permease [Patescibacteria group bacterium]
MDIFYLFQVFADFLIYQVFKISENSHIGESLNFFVYDTLKIVSLLLVINFFMAGVNYFVPAEKIRNFLSSRKFYGFDYLMASILGVITPFCSCSSIPLFIGFLSAGIPLGITFAFLITSPIVNEASLFLFPALFGWKITLLYNVFGILIGMIGGYIIQKLKLEKQVENFVWKIKNQNSEEIKEKFEFWQLVKQFLKEGILISKKIIPFVVIGVLVSSFIHGFVPSGFFEKYITKDNFFAVPIATILAIPLYANSISVLPVLEVLVGKGIPIGTAMSFMMAVVGLSFPEALILRKVMKPKLLFAFYGITAVGIILIGYLFNLI